MRSGLMRVFRHSFTVYILDAFNTPAGSEGRIRFHGNDAKGISGVSGFIIEDPEEDEAGCD